MTTDTQSHGKLVYSEVDSRRFGLTVHRAVLETLDERTVLRHFLEHRVDVAIVRLPWEEAARLSRLDRVGLPYLVADTLVYYSVDLGRYQPQPLRNQDLSFVECDRSLLPELDRLVEEIFPGYQSHYAANPLFATDMLQGYKEWAHSYGDGSSPERRCWLARRGGESVAFATFSCRGETTEGVLYGVSARASGGGVYGDLIRYTQQVSREVGAERMEVSTQSHNYAVQKVWGREGFAPVRSYLTAHINGLLGRSVLEPQRVPLRISAADIRRTAEASGDWNDVHFDDEVARGVGFDGRIAHGLVPVGAISRHYGTVTPGPGTIFSGYSYRFFKPLYLDRDYEILFTYPVLDTARSAYRAVARIYDAGGGLCLLSYSDLVKKIL